ncbi:MAG: endonuclease III [Ruminococcaceae bacterium]|nr:endonuclease III [Oscillospiraceae bacterium]
MEKKLKKEAAAKLPRLFEEFDKLYPDAECSLNYDNPLQLLISTRLSAQCTDARVNMVTPALFERYPDCKAFAEADIEELEGYIRSTGFFRSKARNIIDCCKALLERHNGEVPDTMEELTALAGVGRKTANLVLGDAFGKPSYVVDTHCIRLCNRIGLTDNSDPVKIEKDLREILPPERSGRFCHQLVLHGRAYCTARKPKCSECSIRSVCRMAKTLPLK